MTNPIQEKTEATNKEGVMSDFVCETINPDFSTDIWLKFNTVTVGMTPDGKPRGTYDVVELLNGLIALGHAVSIQFANHPFQQPVEESVDDIEEVKAESKWQHNGQPDNPTTNE